MSIFTKLPVPIALAPMANICTPQMAIKACQSGIIGSMGAGMMSAEKIEDAIREIKEGAPGMPFNINLFVVDEKPEFTSDTVQATKKWLSKYCKQHHYIDLDLFGKFKPPYAPSFEKQFAQILESKPPIVSFTFGLVSADKIKECQNKGIEVWGTATSVEEAKLWKEAGVDAVVLQGAEAGGHRGSLTTDEAPSSIPLNELYTATQQVCTDIPLIVAGGIMDGHQARRYVQAGAVGVQIGTLFMGASDSHVSEIVRRALYGELGNETVVTRCYTGRWARGIKNKLAEFGENEVILPYPVQNKLTQPLRAEAAKRGDIQSLSLWAGTGFPYCKDKSIKELVDDIKNEYFCEGGDF